MRLSRTIMLSELFSSTVTPHRFYRQTRFSYPWVLTQEDNSFTAFCTMSAPNASQTNVISTSNKPDDLQEWVSRFVSTTVALFVPCQLRHSDCSFCIVQYVRFLVSKTVVPHVLLPFLNLKEGLNTRQCAQRGISILEESIRLNGWVDTSIVYVTVQTECEEEFRKCLPHFELQQCAATAVKHGAVAPAFDETLASWILNECVYVLIDGHHRVKALVSLKQKSSLRLPDTIRCLNQRFPQSKQEMGNVSFQVCPYTPCRCAVLLRVSYLEKFVLSERLNRLTHDTISLSFFDWMQMITSLRKLMYAPLQLTDVLL